MRSIAFALILLLSAVAAGHAQTARLPTPPAPAAAPAAAAPAAGTAAGAAAGTPASALAAADAQKALAVLKDPAKLAELVAVLEAIAKAQPAEPATALPFAPDSLGAQLLVDTSRRLAMLSEDLVATLRTVTDFPLLWRFVVQLSTDPWSRDLLFNTLWRLAMVFGAGLAAQWGVRRLLRRPMAALAARGKARRDAETATSADQGIAAAEAGETEPARHGVAPLVVLRRVPGALGRLALLLLPILAFLAAGFAMLGAGLGADGTTRLTILGLMNAFAICRVMTSLLRALVGPGEPALFHVREAAAEYALRWLRRIAAVAVFGYTLAEIGLLFGLYRIAHDALIKLVVLAVHVLLVVVVLQNRARVAAWLRCDGQDGVFAVVRNWFASIWHLVAIFYLLALWAVWALDVPDGFTRLLRVVVVTVAVVLVGRFALTQVLRLLRRWTTVPPELAERYPGLDVRIGAYHPVARTVVIALMWAITLVVLFEAWGFDAISWFGVGKLGGRLVAALGTMATTVVLALLAWELANAAIQRHLAKLAREAQLARSARLRTLLPMVRTALLVSISLVAGLMVLSEIGVNIAPLLAGAGVVGIAIGFGSQRLVQDIITGLFLLLENTMQVGDAVTLGGLSGGVEALSVRTIRLRADDGSVHIVPFSAVTTVTNMTRDFGFAVFEYTLGVNEEPDRIIGIVREVANGMRTDEAWSGLILDDVEIWGVGKFLANAWVLQGRIKSTASSRWAIRRELNRRVKYRFDELGIDSPLTSWDARKETPPTMVGFVQPGG